MYVLFCFFHPREIEKDVAISSIRQSTAGSEADFDSRRKWPCQLPYLLKSYSAATLSYDLQIKPGTHLPVSEYMSSTFGPKLCDAYGLTVSVQQGISAWAAADKRRLLRRASVALFVRPCSRHIPKPTMSTSRTPAAAALLVPLALFLLHADFLNAEVMSMPGVSLPVCHSKPLRTLPFPCGHVP